MDSGAESSFITTNCIQRLGLQPQNINVTISGVGEASPITSNGFVNLNISSRYRHSANVNLDALILPKISSPLTAIQIDENMLPQLKNLS